MLTLPPPFSSSASLALSTRLTSTCCSLPRLPATMGRFSSRSTDTATPPERIWCSKSRIVSRTIRFTSTLPKSTLPMREKFNKPLTISEARKGTGLGLAVTYGIIQEHAGAIEVSSTPGEGTIFRLELPAADAAGAKNQVRVHPEIQPGATSSEPLGNQPPTEEGKVVHV